MPCVIRALELACVRACVREHQVPDPNTPPPFPFTSMSASRLPLGGPGCDQVTGSRCVSGPQTRQPAGGSGSIGTGPECPLGGRSRVQKGDLWGRRRQSWREPDEGTWWEVNERGGVGREELKAPPLVVPRLHTCISSITFRLRRGSALKGVRTPH